MSQYTRPHVMWDSRTVSYAFVLGSIFASGPSFAQTSQQASAVAESIDEIVITGYGNRQLLLDSEAKTGTRLGLTVRETPAIVDILSQSRLLELGARTSIEALSSAPGITSANLPSAPGQSSIRGFTGGAVSLLFDGVRITAGPLVTRPVDTWAFERFEVLKGPGSVLYGEGSLAGAINLVPKRPQFEATAVSGLASYGSFDSLRVAGDVNMPLGEKVAARAVASYSRSAGYVDDTASDLFAGTLSVTFRPTERLTLELAGDYLTDEFATPYWGTPLIAPAAARDPSDIVRSADGFVLDRALRDTNFNVDDGVSKTDTVWGRSRLTYTVNDTWTLVNEFSVYDADRYFRSSETYTFSAATGLFNRSTTRIDHHHKFWVERGVASADAEIGGFRNRFSAGFEFSENTFFTPRRFGNTTPATPASPVRGVFPITDTAANFPGVGNRVNFDSNIKVASAFVEDALNLTPDLLVVGGLRYEAIKLDRIVEDLNAGTTINFARDYKPVSWRIGTVYSLAPQTQVFAQYSSAVAPVGSLVLISQANAQFNLTGGRSVEGGIKSSFLGDRIDLTLAAYWIEQDDIITRHPANTNLTIQGGTQSSRGVEASLSAAVTSALRFDANFTVLDSRFDQLIEAGGLDRKGNTPPNVPETVANVFAVYAFDSVPVTVTGGFRSAGRFFTNNANTIRVAGRTTFDASVGYRFAFGDLTLRGRNLTDKLYGEYVGGQASQVLIGPPRSFDVTFTARF